MSYTVVDGYTVGQLLAGRIKDFGICRSSSSALGIKLCMQLLQLIEQ